MPEGQTDRRNDILMERRTVRLSYAYHPGELILPGLVGWTHCPVYGTLLIRHVWCHLQSSKRAAVRS
ncbi:hypothetical protein DPMN_028714 [Dreissena polymorpha]|uniref:Uncharacterized protein n=1 Tax=Dreissena polymorpha TaxID=45954 RepID=A0A9D4LV70_DREPO|nr:hypothetical protein DPMN_028714 [Dreissena polymorpha]